MCLLANILYRADCAADARKRYSTGCKQPNERSQCKKTSSEYFYFPKLKRKLGVMLISTTFTEKENKI